MTGAEGFPILSVMADNLIDTSDDLGLSRVDAARLDAGALRQVIREERWTDTTIGLGLGQLQANLAIVPKEDAYDFLLFCQRNPKPVPLLEVLDVGSPIVREIAADADVRTDLPRYRVFRNGELESEPLNLVDVWEDDAVGFLLGCSLTFEQAMLAAGLPLRHIEADTPAPVYITDRQCAPAGKFSGPMVVSMRPIPADQVARAVQVTSRYPWGHGAPVHVGDPAALGIADLSAVDFGHAPNMKDGDIPVFWGCGITPQLAVESARPRYTFTHYAQHMFVSDRSSEADAAL
ncbi:putative hydro-lyase [Nocardioides sp. LHD-245]|uniref:putative hydro-lyase n=1 Tax=Nocardioides sp. LHD-245 TaxID=3051387 RepID=UPI0027E06569|nr:putative hydro-lyase [Nocardioides sp. LHD-245]